MHCKRLAVALAATTAAAGLLTAPAASASGSVSEVASACPSGTVHSELVGEDDFAPETTPSATWTSEPAGRFEVKQDATASDGWLMHAAYGEDGTGARTDMTPGIQLPQGRRLVVQVNHSFDLANGAFAMGRIYANYTTWDENPSPVLDLTGSDDGYFHGNSSGMTSTADISSLAGRTVWFGFTLGNAQSAPTQAGWGIDDIAIYVCDDDQPSAPTEVVTKPGFTEIETTWQPPGWRPENVDGYQVNLTDIDDSAGNRTVDLPADARSWRFSGLTPGHSYRVEVGTGGRTTRGPRLKGSEHNLAVPLSQTVSYPGNPEFGGYVTCSDSNYGVPVVLQRRYKSTGSWVTFETEMAHAHGWSSLPEPHRHTEYRALAQPGKYGERTCMGRISKTVRVKVRMAIFAGTTKDAYVTPEPVVVKGKARPAHDGMLVYLQRYYSDGWHSVSSQRLSSDSTYRFSFRKSPGRYWYRVLAPTHSDHLGAVSHRVYVRVHDGCIPKCVPS